ncbi:MAG: carbon-nitrogen hydrolase family protein [Proteobacteria bacterium]|nr:carbon-nitrogen hydrolase family protein [Pseudomonadota bacterium]
MVVEKRLKVALVQESPVFLNLPASILKAKALIGKAAATGAKMVVFPETWLPGYPVWLDTAKEAALWDHQGAKSLYRLLCQNSLALGSEPFRQLQCIAGEKRIQLVMGCHEINGNTLYNTMVFFSANGQDFQIHRKLIPTYNEQMIWGRGDGSTLKTLDSELGPIGGLICWEHWMPLARAAMHARKEVVHVAQWPSVIELHQLASRHYAFEGRCFVLACGCVLSKKQVLEGFDSLEENEPEARRMLENMATGADDLLMTGGSAVIGPTAAYITPPSYDPRAIVYADLNPALIREAAMVMDTNGHYARPDVFSLSVNDAPMGPVDFLTEK